MEDINEKNPLEAYPTRRVKKKEEILSLFQRSDIYDKIEEPTPDFLGFLSRNTDIIIKYYFMTFHQSSTKFNDLVIKLFSQENDLFIQNLFKNSEVFHSIISFPLFPNDHTSEANQLYIRLLLAMISNSKVNFITRIFHPDLFVHGLIQNISSFSFYDLLQVFLIMPNLTSFFERVILVKHCFQNFLKLLNIKNVIYAFYL